MPRPLPFLAALGVLGALGCAPAPEQQPPAAIVARFIDEESAESPTPDRLYTSREVFRWSFASPDEAARWRLRDAAATPVPGGRLLVEARGPAAAIELSVRLDASGVDRIELRLAGQPSGPVELSWAGPLQRFSSERVVAVETGEAAADVSHSFAFELRGHPRWTGRIARLRIAPFHGDRTRVGLVSLSGSRRVADPERLAGAATRPWKVELNHDARNALLALPGRSVERRVLLPEAAALRFGYGLERGTRTPVRFDVTVVADAEPSSAVWRACASATVSDRGRLLR